LLMNEKGLKHAAHTLNGVCQTHMSSMINRICRMLVRPDTALRVTCLFWVSPGLAL